MKDTNILINNGIDVNASLELFGDIETYNETVIDFLDGLQDKLDNIDKYKETSDMNNYSILVHSLKSDAKYLGLTSLADIAYKHELKSKDRDVRFVYDNYNKLLCEVEKYTSVLKKYIGDTTHKIEIKIEQPKIKSNKKILVVDDSDIIQNYLKRMFKDEYDILTATDGIQALETISSDNGEIIAMLLDLNMPNVSGYEVLEYMHKNNLFVKVPVAIITGEDSKDALEKVREYPITDVISKPFNERDVKSTIVKMINRI